MEILLFEPKMGKDTHKHAFKRVWKVHPCPFTHRKSECGAVLDIRSRDFGLSLSWYPFVPHFILSSPKLVNAHYNGEKVVFPLS